MRWRVEFVLIVNPNTFKYAKSHVLSVTHAYPFSRKKIQQWGILCVRKLKHFMRKKDTNVCWTSVLVNVLCKAITKTWRFCSETHIFVFQKIKHYKAVMVKELQ